MSFTKIYSLLIIISLITVAFLPADPVINVIPGEQMRLDVSGSSVTDNGSSWTLNMRMANDNDHPNGVLSSTFRRWWHAEISGLDSVTSETLDIEISNAGYSDIFTPVWSLDGGLTYERISGVTPTYSSGTHYFTINTPVGVSSIRLSKYFPYTPSAFNTFRASFNTHQHVTENILGTTALGRSIYMYEITDSSVVDTGKHRVWIHTCVHPAENTAYFTVEGLINWLTSNLDDAETLLDNIIFDIVPMANPDGNYLGNYRTNSDSINLENEWSAPYDSTVEEIVALRTQIETFMGTASSPGANPIKLLLNMHSSHGLSYPFHFVHVPDYFIDGTGVTPSVNTLEQDWVTKFQARSSFVNMGSSSSSTMGSRPYVESMMHDRYSIEPEWDDVMAITFEGTYERGPISGVPNTPDDYRQVGLEMGKAIADFFGISLPTFVDSWALY